VQHLETGHARHHHVEDHDVGAHAARQLQRFHAVVGLYELVGTVQADADQLSE
jgi:hypothetical protein